MSVDENERLQKDIMAVLCGYSGRRRIELNQMISRDVGIFGGDGVQILYDLEERFGVDLNPLIKNHTTYLPPSWWDRFRGRQRGRAVTDMKVHELVDYIANERRNRRP